MDLDWEVVQVLGSASDPVSPSPGATVATDGHTFLVGPLEGAEGHLAVYTREGYRGLVGRAGDGPAEFRRIRQVQYADGTFHVFSEGRETVFDRELELIETRQLHLGFDRAVTLDRETSIVHGWIPDPGTGAALTIHRYNAEGGEPLGPRIQIPRDALSLGGLRLVIGRAPGNSFWSAVGDEYAFWKRTTDGTITRRIELDPDWFAASRPPPQVRRDPFLERIPPLITALYEDAGGFLWVATMILRADWEPMMVPPQRRSLMYPAITETVIEVVDLQSSSVIAHCTVPEMIVAFLGDGMAAARATDSVEVTQIRVLALSLARRDR